jgi:hypothetical protein
MTMMATMISAIFKSSAMFRVSPAGSARVSEGLNGQLVKSPEAG